MFVIFCELAVMAVCVLLGYEMRRVEEVMARERRKERREGTETLPYGGEGKGGKREGAETQREGAETLPYGGKGKGGKREGAEALPYEQGGNSQYLSGYNGMILHLCVF